MIKNNAYSIWSILIVSLFCIGLVSCQAQSTIAPTPPGPPVTSLDEIVGRWQSKCYSDPCFWTFNADGTYEIWESLGGVNPPTFMDGGKITLSPDGVFQIQTTKGWCLQYDANPVGSYQAFLIKNDGKPSLLYFQVSEKDMCKERQRHIQHPLSFVNP